MMVDWLRTLVLRPDDIEVRSEPSGRAEVRFIGGAARDGGGRA
jgi:hypothetical protein